MKMKLFVILALSALCLIALPGFTEGADPDTVVTVVEAPDQTEAQRPPCFPDGYRELRPQRARHLRRPHGRVRG